MIDKKLVNTQIWKVTVLRLFPDIFPGPLNCSILGKSLNNIWRLETLNIRDFTDDNYRTVDDRPFGGGSGMVMRPDVVGKAIDHVIKNETVDKLIYMSPRGCLFTQKVARELAQFNSIAIICGRFEGIDERIIEEYNIEEISIGDFV